MSEDRAIHEADSAEEHTATDEGHSHGCFQVSALCCCLTKRRMYLPGRRPRDRKKKNWKKKDAEDPPCFRNIMLEEGQQNLGPDYWSTTFVGDLDSVQTEVITAGREVSLSPLPPKPLPLCTQSYDKKSQGQHIPGQPLSTSNLEKVGEYDRGKTEKTVHTPGKAQQPKEGLDRRSAFSLAAEKTNVVAGTVSEDKPLEEGKDYSVTPVKGNRQSGNPELPNPLLQEVADEKKQRRGGTCAGRMPEGEPCKEETKQDDKSQEPQEPADLEQLHSALAANEKKSQEEQNNTSTDSEGVTTLQELLNQPCVPCIEEQQLLAQQPVTGVTHEVEKQVTREQMNSVFEGKAHKKNRDYGDTLHPEEVQQPGELKYPDIMPAMDANDDQEQQEVLYHLDFVAETSPQKTGHDDQPLHEWEDQLPIRPKATSFSFQDTTYEKKQKEIQDIRLCTSDTILSKGEDRQYVPHQADQHAAPPEHMTTFPLGTIYTTDMQRPGAHTDYVPQDPAVYITGQKQPETQQLILVQQIKTPHYNIANEKEEQEGLDHAYFGSKGIVCTEEQEYQEPVALDDVSMLTDNISCEKEQQRNLDCGDSGPESICDKDEQDQQPALFLEAQEPLVLAKLSSLPLNETSEEQHSRKDNANAGSPETPCLDGQQAEPDDQGQMLLFAASTEKERIQSQEEPQPPMAPLAGCNTEGVPQEARQDQKATSVTCEEQKPREHLTLRMTCEEHHKKEKRGLSNIASLCNLKKDEGHV